MGFVKNFMLFLAVKNVKIGRDLAKLQQVKPCMFLGHSVGAEISYIFQLSRC